MSKDLSILETVMSLASAMFECSIEPTDDLFSLGADSITTMEFASRLEDALGWEIELYDLWDSESFLDLASRIERSHVGSAHLPG